MTRDESAPRPSSAHASRDSSARIGRNAFFLLLGQAGTTTLAVVLAAALGRFLSLADFGLFFLLTSTSTFAYVLVEWGQGPYVIREIARHPERSGSFLATAILLRMGGGASMALLSAVALLMLGYDRMTGLLAALFIAMSLPYFLAQSYSAVFRGLERMGLDSLVSVANKAMVVGFTVAAFRLGGGLLGAILALGAAGLLALALASSLARRLRIVARAPSASLARELFRGGSPIVAMSLAAAAQTYLDVLILSRLAPVEAVGWYGAARNIFGTILAAASILGTAAFPQISRVAHEPALLRKEIGAGMRPLLGLAALAGVGSYLFADVAVGIVFGRERFSEAASIIRAFAPGQALLFVDVFLGMVIVAVGRSRALALAKVVNIALVVALNFLLIPYFQSRHGNGGIGVVVAFSIGELVMLASALWILPRGTIDRPLLLDVARAVVAGAGTLLLFRVIPAIPPVVGIPLCIAAFLGLALAVGLVRRGDLAVFHGF